MGASIWVPLVTAAAGLIAGLAAGLVSTVLARRWSREDRAAAWQREDALRWHADRLQAYVRLIAALNDWDVESRRVWDRRPWTADAEEPPPFDAAEWERHARAVNELHMVVFLIAPEKVRDLAMRCRVAYVRLGREYLADQQHADPAARFAAGDEAAQNLRRLIEAMRADLGMGGGGPPEPRPAHTAAPG